MADLADLYKLEPSIATTNIVLTGTPLAPTALLGTNTTQIATTAFVQAEVNKVFTREAIAVPALDINCSLGNYYTKTINADSTFTFSNPPNNAVYSFTLEVNHISGTITWPASVVWPTGTPPSLTSGKTHLFFFASSDTGVTWRGSFSIDY